MRHIKTMPPRIRKIGLVLGAVLVFVVGFWLRGLFSAPTSGATEKAATETTAKADQTGEVTWWTCSMHPQIKLRKPGQCPICGMALIPLEKSDTETASLRELSLSEEAVKLMQIETVPVERRFVGAQVRMVGMVDYDETRLKYITAWIAGRLDRLFVDYTGVPVQAGDHMVYLYSPELLSAQEELLQAIKAAQRVNDSTSELMRRTTDATVKAAREKLRLWGLTEAQVAEIEERGTPSDHMTIYAPTGGIVIHKNAQEGMYVKTGTRIYTIADLSKVWVQLDAYESDLTWLHYGQAVQFTTESYPGQVFTGRISFIDPVLTEATRTVKVRVDVDNPDLRLKPGMFVSAVVRAQVATAGRVMSPDLAGKWICPMHPDVVKDDPGFCDVCGMALVPAESLGYVSAAPEGSDMPLVIPTTAALITGTRAVVYVEVPDQDKPTFEGREIVLGPRAGDFYLVRSGLKEGERVVTKGNFTIDAELQIQAKPSMMTPEGGGGGGMHMNMDMGGDKAKAAEPNTMSNMTETTPAAVRIALQEVMATGETVDQALAGQELAAIRKAFADLKQAVAAVPKELLTGHPALQWQEYAMLLTNDGVEGSGVDTLAEAQNVTASLHKHLQSMAAGLGLGKETKPMAMPVTAPPAFHTAFDKVVQDYLRIAQALATDKADQTKAAAQQALDDLHAVDMKLLRGDTHMRWMSDAGTLEGLLGDINEARDIEQMRQGFAPLSEQIATTVRQFGWTGKGSLYQFHCPMAFNNQGANWLQNTDQTQNPYFGAAMPTCGSVVDMIASSPQKETPNHEQ